MKRLWLVLVLALSSGMAFAQTPPPAPPGKAVPPGMMGNPAPGRVMPAPIMRSGMGPGSAMEESPAIKALPQEKRDQLQKLRVETQEKLSGLAKQAEAQSVTLGEVMRTYPVDVAAAKKSEAALSKLRGQMFDVRVESLAKQQQIIGKDAWMKMQEERKTRPMERPMPPPGAGPRVPPPGALKQ